MRFPLVLLLLAPFIEIASLIWVGQFIGVLATLALIMLSGILGVLLLRSQGLIILRRLQSEASQGANPGRELIHGALIVVAAILLIIPGFVSDIVGLLLFLPPLRDLAWKYVKPRVVVRHPGFSQQNNHKSKPENVVDLDTDEYRRDPDPNSPWRGPSIGKE